MTSLAAGSMLLAGLGSWGCAASHRITRFDPATAVEDKSRAAYYALPRTVLQVAFSAKKVETERGECFSALDKPASDAGLPGAEPIWKILGFRKPPVAGAYYSIEGTPALAVLAEPDPDQIFRADLASSFFVKRKIELNYGPLGVLQSATSLAQDRTLDYTVSVAKLATGIGVLSWMASVDPVPSTCWETVKAIHSDREYLQQLPEKVHAGSISKSEAEWFKGELQARIDRSMIRFVKRSETMASVSCLARPQADSSGAGAQNFKLLFLQDQAGLSPLGGGDCLIPGAFISGVAPAEGVQFSLSVEPQSGQLEGQFVRAKLDKAHDEKKEQGFYYRIPAVARVSLRGIEFKKNPTSGAIEPQGTAGTQILFSNDAVVAQLGIVAALPAQHAYQTQYAFTLDPMTGALQKLTSESETPDPKLIGTLESALDEELKARADAKKAAAAATDELALLERQRKLLEEQKKIRDLTRDLGGDAP